MQWNKSGRPKTDNEYRPKDKKEGMKMLAVAVLKQWLEDGKPDDLPKEWVAVLKFLMEGKDDF